MQSALPVSGGVFVQSAGRWPPGWSAQMPGAVFQFDRQLVRLATELIGKADPEHVRGDIVRDVFLAIMQGPGRGRYRLLSLCR